jgi:DNA-binding transcriptional MerR regulator
LFLVDKQHYSVSDVEKLTGIKRHNLVYYDLEGLFSPSVARSDSNIKWVRRKYSVLDVLVLQAVAELKDKGMSFNKIRKVIEYLRENHDLEKPFHAALDGRHNVRILTDGTQAFYICFNDHEVVEYLKRGGQYMLIDISDVAFDLKEKIKALQLYKRKKEAEKCKLAHVSSLNAG